MVCAHICIYMRVTILHGIASAFCSEHSFNLQDLNFHKRCCHPKSPPELRRGCPYTGGTTTILTRNNRVTGSALTPSAVTAMQNPHVAASCQKTMRTEIFKRHLFKKTANVAMHQTFDVHICFAQYQISAFSLSFLKL